MIDTLKQAKIDSLNTRIEKCKQSIARLNDKLTNIKSNIDKKYIKPLIKIGFSESDANNMWKMAEIMEFKCYKDRYSYFDFKHPDTHIGIDVVKYLSQYEELRIFCDAHAHIDNANKEIKSLNVMLVT